jgi:hypothetical protein
MATYILAMHVGWHVNMAHVIVDIAFPIDLPFVIRRLRNEANFMIGNVRVRLLIQADRDENLAYVP